MSSLTLNPLTLFFAAAFAITLGLLIRSLFRQAGIQDAIKETTEESSTQMKLWEEFGQHLDEGVALVNDRNEIEYVNSAFAILTGWPNRSAFHQQLNTIVHLQNDEAQEVPIPTSTNSDMLYCIAQDGARTPVHAVKRGLRRPPGYTIAILQNASAENAEKELRHRLVNLSSFELRAPVTAMKGYASMLIDGDAGKVSKEALDYIKPIFESTETLLTLINDMASVEELSTKKAQVKKKVIGVNEFLEEVSGRLNKVAEKAERELSIQPGISQAKFEIDRDQIARLLIMLTNTAARTAAPKTTVQLTVEESPRTIDVHLTNQGDPLPKQSQANVFDYVGGRGLDEGIGFYVAKQIIESHHAFVTVNTRAEGNVFVVSLPKVLDTAPTSAPPVTEIEQVEEATGAVGTAERTEKPAVEEAAPSEDAGTGTAVPETTGTPSEPDKTGN